MSARPLTPEDVRERLDVSRETVAKLEIYLSALQRWNRSINLVAPTTLKDPWRRHILDCGQLAALIPEDAQTIADMGSGAGLPGMILAMMNPKKHLLLIESDGRKCAFLRLMAAELSPNAEVIHERLKSLERRADIVTARALAPLSALLDYAEPLKTARTRGLFLKGRGAKEELTEAGEYWNMHVETRPSLSDASGQILIIANFRRRLPSERQGQCASFR